MFVSTDNRSEKMGTNEQNKMNGGLSSNTVKPREDLPPLLVNLAERERERVHWTGTAFGLTSEL